MDNEQVITPLKRKPHSELTKQKISAAAKGRKIHPNTISARLKSEKARHASISNILKASVANKGKVYSIERIIKIKAGLKRFWDDPQKRIENSTRQKGEKAYNWKGGRTPENRRIRQSIEFRLWREAVFARDQWRCQECDYKGKHLHPHHIKHFADYPELRFAIDNGVTLCAKCHQEKHKKIKLSEVSNG